MALQVWLPLNGNIKNQGLSSLQPVQTTAPTYVNGKLGKAMSTGAFYLPATEVAKFYNNNAMSWAFWIYPTTSGSVATPIIGQSNTGAGDCRMFTIFQYPNGVDLHLSWQTEAGGNALASILSDAFTVNTWNHCAITYDGSTIRIYINGDIKATYTNRTSNRTNFNYNVPIPNSSSRYLSDVRIYDHCLSPKEIELISRGLIVHYPMNGGGRSGANLFRGTMKNEYVIAGNAQESITMGAGSGGNGVFSITEDNTVPCGNLSWNITGNTTGNRDYQQYVPYISGHKYTLSWYAKGNGTCLYRVWNRGNSSQPLAATVTLTSDWKYYTWTFTATEDIGSNTCTAQIGVTGNSNINICGMKIEEGDKATPWIPHTSDEVYTTMGYNNIEYDTSGYNNHGTINGTVECNTDTLRYSICTDFNKSGYIINNAFNTYTHQFTFNIWVKPKSKSSQHFLFGTFGSWTKNGIGIWRDDNSNYSCLVKSDSESSYSGTPRLAYTLNTWNMFTLVYTGTNFLGYVNGIQQFNLTYGSGGVINNPVFMIANSKFNNTPASENEEAYISDVRFYTTALTKDQIKELYQSSASIDKNGNMYAYEYNEV